MTTLLQPLLTRSLWLDVARQAIAELFRCIDRVTDSLDVFMRILIASSGIAVSSVFLLYVYPVLTPDLQLLALSLTGLLWYLCLYQIKPEHEYSVFPSLMYMVAIVSVAIPVFGLGLYQSNVYWVIIGNAMISVWGPVLGVFFAIKLLEFIMNNIVMAFRGFDVKPGTALTQHEKNSITLASVILGEKPRTPEYLTLAVYTVLFAVTGVWLVFNLPTWPWSVVTLLIAAVCLRLANGFWTGAFLASDPEIDKVTLTHQPRQKRSFKQKLQALGPLTTSEAEAVKENRRFKGFTVVVSFGQLIFSMLYPLLTTANTREGIVFFFSALIVSIIAFLLCMLYLDFLNRRLIKSLKAARAS